MRSTAAGRAALLALLLAAAFALRLVTFSALTRDRDRLLSADDYGHLRRITATVRSFPSVPYADPYLAHPQGGRWIWPPLFDFALALPARALWGADAPVERIARLAAWAPPLLGALALLPLAALGRYAFGRRTGYGAAAVYAVLPAAIAWSAYGHSDQHVAEALAFLLVLASFAAWSACHERGPRERLRLLGLALSVAAAVLIWQGAVFLAPLIGLAASIRRRGGGAAIALLGAALAVAPFAALAGGPTTYISFGPFQPLFLALCGVLVGLASRGRWGLAAAAVTGVAVSAFWPPIAGALLHLASASESAGGSSAYLSYPREWLALIGEYRPLLGRGLWPVVAQLSLGLLLLPLAWLLWLRDARREDSSRDDGRRGALVLLLCAAPTVLAMALLQRRYIYYLAPLVALALADLVSRAANLRPAFAVVLGAIALAPTVPAIAELRAAPGAPGVDLLRTLEQLAAIDPPKGDPFRPAEVAPGEVEGVMAPWSIGHLVSLYARRPAAADNFGYGFFEQARFFTAPPEKDAEALAQLLRLRCRYVVSTDLRPVLAAYAAAAGRPGMALDSTLAMRLLRAETERPLPFLRRVVVSESVWLDETGRPRPRFEIYRVEVPAVAGSASE